MPEPTQDREKRSGLVRLPWPMAKKDASTPGTLDQPQRPIRVERTDRTGGRLRVPTATRAHCSADPQRHAVIVLGRHSAPLAAPAHLERYRRSNRFAAGERMSRPRPPPAKWLEAVNQAESPRQEYAGPMIRGDSATDIEHRLALALGEYLRLQGLAADMNDRSTCDVSPRIADPHGRRT